MINEAGSDWNFPRQAGGAEPSVGGLDGSRSPMEPSFFALNIDYIEQDGCIYRRRWLKLNTRAISEGIDAIPENKEDTIGSRGVIRSPGPSS